MSFGLSLCIALFWDLRTGNCKEKKQKRTIGGNLEVSTLLVLFHGKKKSFGSQDQRSQRSNFHFLQFLAPLTKILGPHLDFVVFYSTFQEGRNPCFFSGLFMSSIFFFGIGVDGHRMPVFCRKHHLQLSNRHTPELRKQE